MKATQQLKDEHEGIRLMLSIIEKISEDLAKGEILNNDHYEKIIDFLKGFADKCHHGKEEEILFPAMINQGVPKEGGPIALMLHEHRLGREYVKSLSEAFEDYKSGDKNAADRIIRNSLNYVELLKNHIEKENNILFLMADRILDEHEQSELFEAFEKMETEKIGIGKHSEYHHMLEELKELYLG